jgi:hypothetical protein
MSMSIFAIADGLRRRGIDVTTTVDANLLGLPIQPNSRSPSSKSECVAPSDQA